MDPKAVGLRERKKTLRKLAIMNVCIKALEDRELTDIKVDDLCDELNISKVTFFNYFTSKDQILEYFVRMWQFEVSGMLTKERLVGRDALNRIFDSVGTHPAGRRIMNALMVFFLKQNEYVPMPISDYEYYVFDPEAYQLGTPHQDIASIIGKTLDDLDLSSEGKESMVKHLVAGFYGVPMRLKISGEKNLGRAYREFLDGMFRNT